LLSGWKEPERTLETQQARNKPDGSIERFADSLERRISLTEWQEVRKEWAEAESPARAVAALFQDVLGLWARLQREGEALRVYLGDAFLIWQREGDTAGPVKHPLILMEVELRFDEKRHELSFTEGARPPFLYSELLSVFAELEGHKRKLCRDIVERGGEEQGAAHPLGAEATDAMISQLAAVLDVREIRPPEGELSEPGVRPILQRRPLLLVVPPLIGLQAACDAFLESLKQGFDLPLALFRIVENAPSSVGSNGPEVDTDASFGASPHLDLFFTKPANAAQEEIARRLALSGTVLVQGPPGTGKTHTIANLLGHLLAEGKRVLVTAQTTKALRVLREKVTPPLQPLCVSVLDSDLESRGELEHAINGIVARLTSDVRLFDIEAQTQQRQRELLLGAVSAKERQLREALRSEYEDLVVGGERFAPSQAARLLVETADRDGWLPGPVAPGAPAPLSEAEVVELYRLSAELTSADEQYVARGLPDPGRLIASDEFTALARALQHNSLVEPDLPLWGTDSQRPTVEELEVLRELVVRALRLPGEAAEWELAAAEAGLRDGAHREPWDSLLDLVERAASEYPTLKPIALEYEVVLGPIGPLDVGYQLVGEILAHVENGGSLGWFGRLGKSGWAAVLECVKVSGKRPWSVDEVRAVKAAVRLELLRDQTRRRWNSVMGASGHALPDQHAGAPEQYVEALVRKIRRALGWARESLHPLIAELGRLGADWQPLLDETTALPPHAEVRRSVTCLDQRVLPSVAYAIQVQQRTSFEKRMEAGLASLLAFPWLPAARQALNALRSKDPDMYATALEELWRLWSLRGNTERRRELLHKVDAAAKAWAELLRTRANNDSANGPPGPLREAWLYRQWSEELDRRHRVDVHELQRELGQLKDQVRDVTARLVENLAWASQVRRTAPAQHRALISWLNLARRIGKGTGIRADEFKREARGHMQEARDAVPVWIMPLSRVFETFVPGQSRFDVVILDEASQCDLRAIVAMSLGDTVVVVGDDAQVSPLDIGQGVIEMRALQEEYLPDFKDRNLFDGRASAYEIAQRSFPGGLIRLVEHFRCVPDIIAFSNNLSYKGEIRPLREAQHAQVFPPLVAHRVLAGERNAENQTNRVEALEIASLLCAATKSPEYAGLTMGVVSLLGDAQAREIDTLLRVHLDAAEYKQRRIVCGNPAHFQGDERDVMFISMVYSADGSGPLRLIDGEEIKRRFNVAASRARDQMWVVHSLNAETDLKPGDLRRRLLEHALDPKAAAVAEQRDRTESDFERRVFAALMERGYRIRAQVEVGAYRLDLVIDGITSRVAVECDGDRFHPLEALDRDLERQTVLERLGWRFLRLRGSAYYRRPAYEMDRLSKRLHDLGVEPLGPDKIADVTPSTAVQDVVRRASEVRRAWIEIAGSVDALFERTAAPRRCFRNAPGREALRT